MYGIADNELHRLSNYLKNRQQMVFIQQESSEFKEVYRGVPQGSVLGPLLFLLFINDVSKFTTDGCVLNMYADDVIFLYICSNQWWFKTEITAICWQYISMVFQE